MSEGTTEQGSYNEKRTLHALQVDRGKQAQTVYNNFNQEYKNKPNSTDVEEYDTVYIPEPKGKTTEEGYYKPTPNEKKILIKRFKALPKQEQYKDLLTTYGVIRKKEEVKEWVNNPRGKDIDGIDTSPEELEKSRIEVFKKHIPNLNIDQPTMYIQRPRFKLGTLGVFARSAFFPDKYGIFLKPKLSKERRITTLTHELGHAFDYTIMRQPIKQKLGNLRVNYEKNFGYKTNELFKKNPEFYEEADKIGEKFEPYKNVNNYSYKRYRQGNQEVFANFMGYLTALPTKIGNESKGFRKFLKKEHKPFFKDLYRAERKAIIPLIYGKKKKKRWL